MTENEAIKYAREYIKYLNHSGWEKDFDAIQKLIVATEEIQQYRAIGTIEEFKALKEKNISIEECLDKLVTHCKLREKNHSSCLGCPVRKTYGTKQPQVCKLNMISRPSDLET